MNAQNIIVKNAPASSATDISLVSYKTTAPVIIDEDEYPTVKLVAGFFTDDVKRVTGSMPRIGGLDAAASEAIIVGTIGRSKLIDRLIAAKKVHNLEKIQGHWEASLWQIVVNPVPGVKKALVIIGSDRRGTAYGLLQLSRQIGVSPWYWWADVPTKQCKILTISVSKPTWDEPTIKYRGIFINDEDWGLNQWARNTFEKDLGSIGPKTYEKVFELMLRLRLNYLWPAMHEVTKEFGSIPENWQLAERYGIVTGTSHCEPMLYNNVHWDEKIRGKWNYSINRDTIYSTWQKTAMERGNGESVWTVGIRGIHDRGMEAPPNGISERINLVEEVLKDQRGLIKQYASKEWGKVAQCFVPYKEVLPIYDAGLKVPDDVTLIWVDDNFGYIRRLSSPQERERSGGSGLYWHLSYYGRPHSYTWINTTSPALMWEEFHKAWENQARNIWVINVGDIKPMELGIDYFSKLAWKPEAQQANAQPQFLKSFLTEHFNADLIPSLSELLTEFYRLGTVRKPELMDRDWAVSLSDQNASQLQSAYEMLMKKEKIIADRIPSEYKDAYTEMIGLPAKILTSTGLIFMHDRAKVYGLNQKENEAEIEKLKTFLEKQIDLFNNKTAGGKWRYMMPGTITGKNLPAWNSQVAWPWGEIRQPDTSRKSAEPEVIRPAGSANRQSGIGTAKWVTVPGLGNTGQAMALKPVSLNASWEPSDTSAPKLEYDFIANDRQTSVTIDFMPTFRIYPGMQLRVVVGLDNKQLSMIEVPGSNGKEDENGSNRNQGIRNNYVRSIIDLPQMSTGKHTLFIKAVDPGVVIDRISFLTKSIKH